jgi:pimeloyl-ACP methyl ester carboxylesterase
VTASAYHRLRAHARAGGLLAQTLAPRRFTRDGHAVVEDTMLGQRPTTVMRPRSAPPWPTVVFVNGATPDGRAHPGVRRLGASLARIGYLVYVPDLPGIARGELTPVTLAAAVDCASAAARSPACRSGRVGLVGVSVGGTLALLVAADQKLADRVSVVSCIAPYTDLRNVMRLATTGMYPGAHGLEPYAVPPSLAVGLARSIVAILPPTADARALQSMLRRLDASSPDGLAPVREQPCASLGAAAAAVQELLVNRDSERFDDLYAALPHHIRTTVDALSPLRLAEWLVAPIEIATAPRDRYFPLGESSALARVARNIRVTVTPALAHAEPKFGGTRLAGLARLHAFFARSLDAAAANGIATPGSTS